ncbi:MAG: hypothetical protein MPK10_09930 [Gammaproteobacteria bacterium]|nr:hypothetical protein [Gammaproteobacteria bacterium]MDA7972860.1 hypothetical protein [Gammaproteobacteria bacterium]MDA8024582.1 hypothetical protein [Gammaproteobacteria bacterium]MDA8030342.1 hypothetical protein [Alphaproteobacteria bacterium]
MYPDIDIAETLANALGMPVRARTADNSEQKINPAKMNAEEKQRFVSLLRPYLWWGE